MSGEVLCPSCRGTLNAGTVVCPYCDHILNADEVQEEAERTLVNVMAPSLDDATDNHASMSGSQRSIPASVPLPFDEIADAAQDSVFGAMLEERTGSVQVPASTELKIAWEPATADDLLTIEAMAEPNVVLDVLPGIDFEALQLSPFEKKILAFIDGKRPMARIRRTAALPPSDFLIASALLADRHVLFIKGRLVPDLKAMLWDDLSDDDAIFREETTNRSIATPSLEDLGLAQSDLDDDEDIPPPPPLMSGEDEEARSGAITLYELAMKAMNDGKRARAHAFLMKANELDPDEPQIKRALAAWSAAPNSLPLSPRGK